MSDIYIGYIGFHYCKYRFIQGFCLQASYIGPLVDIIHVSAQANAAFLHSQEKFVLIVQFSEKKEA